MTPKLDCVDYFFAIDMDRTLIDTGAFARMLPRLFGLSAHQTDQYHDKEYRERGKEFDAYGYLAKQQGKVKPPGVEEFMALFPQQGELKQQLLLPGAEELLLALKRVGIAHGVWTKGSEANQLLKLSILRRLVDDQLLTAAILSPDEHRPKARIIETDWYDSGSVRAAFMIPDDLHVYDSRMWAERVVIIDDKPANLEHSGRTPITAIQARQGVLTRLADDISARGMAAALSIYDYEYPIRLQEP